MNSAKFILYPTVVTLLILIHIFFCSEFLIGSTEVLSLTDSTIKVRIVDTLIIQRYSVSDQDKKNYVIEIEQNGIKSRLLIEIPIRFDSRVPIQHFSINGIKLRKGENKEIGSYLQEMFNKPAKFLLEPPGEDWRNLNVYKNYFQKYDSNYISGTNDVESADEGDSDPNQEPTERNFNDYTKINFPLPATIDLEVDLREGQRKLRVLGLDFGFDKLDKGLKSWILNFRNSDEKSGVKNPLD